MLLSNLNHHFVRDFTQVMLVYLVLVTLITGAVWFYKVFVRPLGHWKRRGVKQTKDPFWILGDSWRFVLRINTFMGNIQYLYKQFPEDRYNGIYQFVEPTLMIRDPELIKRIAIKDFEHFVDHRPVFQEGTDLLWERNLFSLHGDEWREMRRVLSPIFTGSKMRQFYILMTDCAQSYIDYLEKDETTVVELRDTFTRYSNDVIASIVFGAKVDSIREPNNDFYLYARKAFIFTGFWQNLKFFSSMFMPNFIAKALGVTLINKDAMQFFYELVMQNMRMREQKEIVRFDMIHLLTEAKKGKLKHDDAEETEMGFASAVESDMGKGRSNKQITDEDIVAQALVFIFGGFETISTTISFVAYEMAVNQDIQEKLRDEINETFARCNKEMTYEALMKMKYMDMVITESLRKWPNAPQLERICTKPYTIQPTTPDEQPLTVEIGTVVLFPVAGLHKDPTYYPDPERFDPDRFSDLNKTHINPYTYMPFGHGPRNCIGNRFALLETKVMLFHLLLNFKIVPTEKSVIPLRLDKKHFLMTAEGGLWFGLERIQK